MAILSAADLAIYAPDVDLDPQQVQSAILRAQMIAEGPSGAHRPLAKQSFTETPMATGNAIARLSRLPIDESVPPVILIRGNKTSSYFGVGSNPNEFIELVEDEDFVLDYELGEIQFRNISLAAETRFSILGATARHYMGYGGRRRLSNKRTNIEIKATYTTGFDFQANPLDPRAEEIKIALGAIIGLQNSSLASGVKQFNYTDFMSGTLSSDLVQLTTTQMGRTPMEDYLEIFRQYRPRTFA